MTIDALLALAPTLALATFAAGVQGFFGFGYGIIVMSALTASGDIVEASAFVNLSSLALSLAMVARAHGHVLWALAARIVPAVIAGLAVGLFALSSLPRDLLVGLLGATIVGISAWNVFGRTFAPRTSAPLDVVVGLISGLFSGAFQTGGPPLVVHLYRRPEPPIAIVVTLQVIFLASGVARVGLAGAHGLIPRATAIEAAIATPAVVAGTLVGVAMARRADPARFRRAAWVALGALGIALLASALG